MVTHEQIHKITNNIGINSNINFNIFEFMKINKNLRIKVCKRKIISLDKKLKNCNPYGFEDCLKIYDDLTYYEDKLQELKYV